MNLKVPHWIDPNWEDGLSELEYNFATGVFKDTYWRQIVGHRLWIRGIEDDEERLTKIYYSKKQSPKPIRYIEWRPIYVNALETQFVNKGQGAWRIFQNPHTKEAKEKYIEMFDWHCHGCFCCQTEMGDLQTSKNYVLNRKSLERHHNDCEGWNGFPFKQDVEIIK
ncbi:MAG: hypothetical protein ACTSPB_10710 [Candidatus Thorarchaeota archaeon]